LHSTFLEEQMNDTLMVVLRIIHIFAGVYWVGSTFLIAGYIAPSVQAAGDAGRVFMSQFSVKSSFSMSMAVAGTLTLIAGLLMYWEIFGFRTAAFESGYGIALSIGALAGILALIFGMVYQFKSIRKMKHIFADVDAAGGPPSPEQQGQLAHEGERIALGGRIGVVLMTIALIGMAVAQYV
jgi:hypothetical protein